MAECQWYKYLVMLQLKGFQHSIFKKEVSQDIFPLQIAKKKSFVGRKRIWVGHGTRFILFIEFI